MNSVAEDVLLLLLDDGSGAPVPGQEIIDRAVAGAVLIDLVALHRISLVYRGSEVLEDRLMVSETAATGMPILDDALLRLSRRSALAPAVATTVLATSARRTVLSRLDEQNLIAGHRSRRFGVLPVTEFRCTAIARRNALRRDLHQATLGDLQSDFHSSAVLALVQLAGGTESVLGKDGVDELRLDDLTAAQWADPSIRPAVAAVVEGVRATIYLSRARTFAATPYSYW